jgi:hypothetical protein
MLPTAPDISVKSTMTGDDIRLTLDEDSLIHLMSQYIDLYTDSELAAVREYSTNALDAHVEAGESRPIEVTTPSLLSPYLRVKDYGNGLSRQDIVDVYSKYGASTKRGSNDFQGMLGLGCKSGLAYTNQFTLSSVKDGRKILVAVSRDEDGAATMTIISNEETDEPSGVEVTIPARGSNQMEAKAINLFQYWPEGSVLLNGAEPRRFTYSMKVSDEIYVIAADRYREKTNSLVVMGNVAYPVERQYIDHGLGEEQGILAFVPIGTVEFTPAREGLRYTRKTKDALAAIADAYKAERDKAIDREIQQASTPREAISTLLRLRKVFGMKGNQSAVYTYRGKDFPATLALPAQGAITSSEKDYGQNYNTHELITTLDITYLPKTYFVRGWDQARFTATTKKKLMKWLEDRREAEIASGLTDRTECNHFVLVDKMPDQTWIDDSHVLEWADIKAIKLPVAGRPVRVGADGKTVVSAGEYEVTTILGDQSDTSLMLAEDFDSEVPIFWVEYQKNRSTKTERDILSRRYADDGFYFIELWANRRDKFLRLFPHAQQAAPECREIITEWQESITDEDRLALAIDSEYGARRVLQSLKPEKIHDPAVVAAIRAANHSIKGLKAMADRFGHYARRNLIGDIEWVNPLDRYPLVQAGRYYADNVTREHEYMYINAVYAADQATSPRFADADYGMGC